MKFYIGWHQPVNGKSGCSQFENAMISVNRLLKRKSHFAVKNWILDSGAFTRISTGAGHLPVEQYAAEIKRWSDCGNLEAAVTQDWMCEKFILDITGLKVADHQAMTIDRYDHLHKALDGCPTYLMPVLQGFTPVEYLQHLDQYGDRIARGAWVGIGSVCKRNGSPSQVEQVLLAIKERRPDLRLHGFGLKKTALESAIVWDLLFSADSQAFALYGGQGSKKYIDANNPGAALKYHNLILQRDRQLSIWSLL